MIRDFFAVLYGCTITVGLLMECPLLIWISVAAGVGWILTPR